MSSFSADSRVVLVVSNARKVSAWLAVVAGMLTYGVAFSARAGEFVPHSAYYKYSLVSAQTGSGIASVDGDMAIEWDQSCDGWTLNQKSILKIFNARGQQGLSLATTVSTWESADGRDYRFAIKNITNRRRTESLEGRARLPKPGAAGWAEYSVPEKRRIALPAGTLFPTRHTIVVLDALPRAPEIISKKVFDGMTLDGLHEINAVIGKRLTKAAQKPELAKVRSWPIHLAFFPHKGTKAEPDHEVGMRLFENGVGDAMVLDFGNFKVRATMERLKLGARPVCN